MILLLTIHIKNIYIFFGGGPLIDESMAMEVSAAVLDVMEAVEGSVGMAVDAVDHTVIILTDPAAPDLLATATQLTRQVGNTRVGEHKFSAM